MESKPGIIYSIIKGRRPSSVGPCHKQMSSGAIFDISDPDPELVSMKDIAHHLSMICRFTGGTSRFYSVAQHSVLVSKLVPPRFALWGLLHDAAEAYIGDNCTPKKNRIPAIKAVERPIMVAICRKFGLSVDQPRCVHVADSTLLAVEARTFLPPHPWHNQVADADYDEVDKHPRIKALEPKAAKRLFLDRYSQILAAQGDP